MKGCLNITVNRIGEGVDVTANRIGNGIAVTCGLVCSVNKVRYIRVEPKQLFLMPGNNFTDEVLIVSNVNWTVK